MEIYTIPQGIGPISFYGLLVLSGFLLSAIFAFIEWRKKGYSAFKFWLMIGWVGAFSVFGAAWWYIIFHPQDWESWWSLFAISGGRSILGSIFFGSLAVYFFTKIWIPEIEWRRALSILLPAIFLGQAIGRWGNFINQEVYGFIMEDVSWLPKWLSDQMYIVVYEGNEIISEGYRQPLFLYESIANLFAFVFITYLMKQIRYFKPGTHGGAYLISYGLVRSIMELFRDEQFIMNWNGFPTSFFMSLIMIIVGISMFIYYQWIFNEKIAIYWQFKYPYKIKNWKENILGIFESKKITNKQTFEKNKRRYNNNICKLDMKDINAFIIRINKEY